MDVINSNFAEIKIGLLTLYAASAEGGLVFLASNLLEQLRLKELPAGVEDYFCVVADKEGQLHHVVSAEGVYWLAFTSRAKVARQFQNWVLHCVLPAVVIDRFYVAGEEDGGTASDLVRDPKESFGGIAEKHQLWLAGSVLPTIREQGDFFTDLNGALLELPGATIKELKLDAGWRTNGGRKLARFRQQASRKRFGRIAKQFQELQVTEDMPYMIIMAVEAWELHR